MWVIHPVFMSHRILCLSSDTLSLKSYRQHVMSHISHRIPCLCESYTLCLWVVGYCVFHQMPCPWRVIERLLWVKYVIEYLVCNTLQQSMYIYMYPTRRDVHYTLYIHILQRTATRCNALQRTATHCDTLQQSTYIYTYPTRRDVHHTLHIHIHIHIYTSLEKNIYNGQQQKRFIGKCIH